MPLTVSPFSDISLRVERLNKINRSLIMETAVIYARYSSENQTEQSIEGQLRVCNDYARNNDKYFILRLKTVPKLFVAAEL